MSQDLKNTAIDGSLIIRTLGTFEVLVSGKRIPDSAWKLKKAKSVVKLLSITKGHRLHRDVILDALWPDLDADSALNNLHKTLFVARRALEPGVSGSGGFVRFHGETLGLEAAGGLEVDARKFESLIATAKSTKTLPEYAAAIEAYRGGLLPDDRYEEWSIAQREELQGVFQALLSEYADLAEADGQVEDAIKALQRMISIEPGMESAHARLMTLFTAQGDRHRAIRQYQSLASALKSEFGIEPQPVTKSLYEDIVGGRIALAEAAVTRLRSGPVAIEARSFLPSDPPLAGREDELKQSEPSVDALMDGNGSVLLISGSAGVGKSRFAEEVARVASSRGALVMRGAAYEFERQAPYGPFSEAFDAFVTALPESSSRAIIDSAPIDIHPLLPRTIQRLRHRREITESHDREFLFSAVESLMRSFTKSAPAVLIIDDLHAADESTFELFHYLARQTKNLPLLIIATFRDEGESPNRKFARALAGLNRIGVGSRMSLEPLKRQAVTDIVARALGGEVDANIVSSVFDSAEGNPLFVEETVRTMVETGAIEKQSGKWVHVADLNTVPEAITQLLTDRMERLSDAARQLLYVASVIGNETDFPILRSASGLSEDVALDALDELLGRHIVLETGDGYRFSHGLHRDVAYEAMSSARRRKTHADVANSILATNPGDEYELAEALAHHFLSSGQREKAAPHLISAGHKAASVYANGEALESFKRAREILEESLSGNSSAEFGALLEGIGDIHARIGDGRQSLDYYKQAMTALEPVNPMASFMARGKAALAAINAEQVEEGEGLLQSIVANISPDYPDFAVARTYLLLAQIGWHSANHAGALESAEKALNAALSSGDDAETARAYEAMALSCHSLGDWQKGIEYELSRAETNVPGFDTDTAFDAHL